MARGAVVAISVHAGWIGGKCRLARLTIASGFGEGIDGSYRGYRRSVFLNRSVATFSWSNSRQENPKTVREFLEKGRDLAECIPYTVIALSALGRCRCFLAVRSDKGEAAFPSAKRGPGAISIDHLIWNNRFLLAAPVRGA